MKSLPSFLFIFCFYLLPIYGEGSLPVNVSLPVKIGFYVGPGTESPEAKNMFFETLHTSAAMAFGASNYNVTNITAIDVENLVNSTRQNDTFDIIVFPGGSGNGQAHGIHERGLQNIRAFVSNGGGYIGTCGGSYLALGHVLLYGPGSSGHGPKTQQPWDRGHGLVNVSFSQEGIETLGLQNKFKPGQNVSIFYSQGPVVKASDLPEDVYKWGIYQSEIHSSHPNKTTGEMIYTPAITARKYGAGRVVLNSPHPEDHPQTPEIYEGELRWVLNN